MTIEGATAVPGDTGSGERFTEQQSWYQVQGLWGSFLLVLFAGFYLLAYRSALRGNYLTLTLMSLGGIALTSITGLSFELFYLPAAASLFLGMLLMTYARLIASRSDTSKLV